MKVVVTPRGDMSDRMVREMEDMVRQRAERQASVCVIYTPNCGCKLDQFYILDRYPMSEKIISQCPECKKGCHMEITDPIEFHLPLTGQDISLEEMADAVLTEGRQKPYLEAYQRLALQRKLDAGP